MPRSCFIKCVAVGDGAVGKTCMLFSYATDKFPKEHIPTVFDTYAVTVTAGDEPYHLTLFDTAGQEEYDRLRLLTYPGTDVFLVCFSVVSPDSFQNIKEKWIPELKQHTLKNTRFILVGTKADLRFDAATLKTLRNNGQKPISPEQGHKLARQISAECYMECSAMTRQGVKSVFDEAIMAVLEPRKKAKKLPSISKLFRMLRSR